MYTVISIVLVIVIVVQFIIIKTSDKVPNPIIRSDNFRIKEVNTATSRAFYAQKRYLFLWWVSCSLNCNDKPYAHGSLDKAKQAIKNYCNEGVTIHPVHN